MGALTDVRTALAFLTRLPGGHHPGDQAGVTASVPWFPVVGVLVGGIGAAVYAGASEVTSPLVAAALAFAATALVTGGFHEDGLADSLDALAGGSTVDRRLEILKDSRHGTFGVLALVIVSIVKIGALADLDGWTAAGALVAAHSMARAGAVGLMWLAPPARTEGLGADYARSLGAGPSLFAVTAGLVVGAVVFGTWLPAVAAAVAAAGAITAWWAGRRIGGVTGDLLGAAEQMGEVVVLVAAGMLAGN